MPDNEALYDADFDALLIEQSIAKQYGVLPVAQKELPYPEWAKLVSGLMDDTPLGRVVAVRREDDPKIIAKMTVWQRRIRSEWQSFQANRLKKRSPDMLRAQMADLERMMAVAFGGGSDGRR